MDVKFINGGPRCTAMDKRLHGGGSLDTFWRSLENVHLISSSDFVWAVSQASPIRRLQVDGNINLYEGYCIPDDEANDNVVTCGAYYASGGYMSNINVTGYVNFGSQQQFLSRNVNFHGGSGGGAWNLVFVGCNGSHLDKKNPSDGRDLKRTNVDTMRVKAEKPYIVVEAATEP